MSKSNKKMNTIQVPDHLLDQVMTYMSKLDVQGDNNDTTNPDQFIIGSLVQAKWNGKWYDATVQKVIKRGSLLTYRVVFIEDGMYDICSSNNVRERLESQDDKELEVKRVLNAKRCNGSSTWQYQILFQDRSIEWVNEHNCFCENKIAEYLEDRGVITHYLLCRVSTKEQASETSTSLEGQENELRAAVANLAAVPRYRTRIRVSNISGSAYKSIPTIMKKIGSAARSGDSIWVWRVDRLSRNIIKYLSWLEDLNNRGVEIYAQSENLCYRTDKIAFIQGILDAQKESAAIGARVKLAYSRKRARGDQRVGCLPYGKRYRRIVDSNGITNRMVVENNPEELAIIRGIKKAYSKNEHPKVTANKLNNSGKFKKGKKWNVAMIKRCQNKVSE